MNRCMRRFFVTMPLCASNAISCGDKRADDSGWEISTTDHDPCLPGPSPTLEIGHGELEYIALPTDTPLEVELIHGPQGGYHVNIALQATQLDQSNPWIIELLGYIDGDLVGETRPYATMRCNGTAEALQSWGLLLIWDAIPAELDGRIANVEATATDASGTSVTATTQLEIWDPALE